MRRIGLLGLTFFSGNKGCSALAYSFLEIINNLTKGNETEVIVFSEGVTGEVENNSRHIKIKVVEYRIKDVKSVMNLKKEIRKCECVFDFTEGDSFSDIYGIKRMLRVSLAKLFVISEKVPLVLGPQTYGPFHSFIAKKLAKYIIKKSYYACARDKVSAHNMEILTGKPMDYYTDIAFALPKSDDDYELNQGLKVGINVSALLWNGGYNSKNQFGLSLDYQQYILRLIDEIHNQFDYEIHLIPHVISADYKSIENDYRICREIADKYTDVIAAPPFETPMEAKRYISQMDVFIGARMHATIAAFSSGVVTIPFSYSIKFEGLYESAGYEYVIHGNTMNLEEAVDTTIEYINQQNELSDKQKASMGIINNKLSSLYSYLEKILVCNS